MTTPSDADRAKAAEITQRKPLTALEWLRVTHADTLSGRRIEEALAEARADERDRLTAAEDLLAEALGALDTITVWSGAMASAHGGIGVRDYAEQTAASIRDAAARLRAVWQHAEADR